MDTHLIAWAAGLFEGEGCMTWKDKEHTKPYLKIEMTDKDVLEQFCRFVAVGSVCKGSLRYQNHSAWKPQFIWRVCRKDEVRRILSSFLPYFGQRRAYKALNVLDSLELTM